MEIHSPAFSAAKPIPAKYTCDGENISVPLQWSGGPAAAQSYALICADPDASNGDWVHWVMYNIPPHLHALPENIERQAVVEIAGASITQGINSWPRIGYGGPCPPSGTHRYFFKLYALSLSPTLPANLSKKLLLEKMHGHIIAEAELMGTYQRSGHKK